MKEIFGNIWDLCLNYDATVITTNGSVKKNGDAVMGKGIALEANKRFPTLAKDLGASIKISGNRVGWWMPEEAIWDDPTVPKVLFTVPTKESWKSRSTIGLVENSAKKLVQLVDTYFLFMVDRKPNIIMPRLGSGAGGLNWEDVKPVVAPILDDRFTVCTFQEN